MKIACLQFAPKLGMMDENLNRADAVLEEANPQLAPQLGKVDENLNHADAVLENIDLLVLPELAFSGCSVGSKNITPYLEPKEAGKTSLWARTTALKYGCVVTVGYPENRPASPESYNSVLLVDKKGETIANYRKTLLGETWTLGPDGFFDCEIPGLGIVAMGTCTGPDPYKFAYHILKTQANLVILSMAGTQQDAASYSRESKEPDLVTLKCWVDALQPVITAEETREVIVVIANRCGVEDDSVYAGTSAVLGIQSGVVQVYGILGCDENKLLVVDTDQEPQHYLDDGDGSSAISIHSSVNLEQVPALVDAHSAPPSSPQSAEW